MRGIRRTVRGAVGSRCHSRLHLDPLDQDETMVASSVRRMADVIGSVGLVPWLATDHRERRSCTQS